MDNKQDQDMEKLKEIPKWTRKYAQNQMLSYFIFIVIIILITMGIGFPAAFAVSAFMKGKLILAGLGIAVLVAVFLSLFIRISKYGGVTIIGWIYQRINQRIYSHEGTASMPEAKLTKKKKWLDCVVGVFPYPDPVCYPLLFSCKCAVVFSFFNA